MPQSQGIPHEQPVPSTHRRSPLVTRPSPHVALTVCSVTPDRLSCNTSAVPRPPRRKHSWVSFYFLPILTILLHFLSKKIVSQDYTWHSKRVKHIHTCTCANTHSMPVLIRAVKKTKARSWVQILWLERRRGKASVTYWGNCQGHTQKTKETRLQVTLPCFSFLQGKILSPPHRPETPLFHNEWITRAPIWAPVFEDPIVLAVFVT